MLSNRMNPDEMKDRAVFAVMSFTVVGLVLLALYAFFTMLHRAWLLFIFGLGVLACAIVSIFNSTDHT